MGRGEVGSEVALELLVEEGDTFLATALVSDGCEMGMRRGFEWVQANGV